MDLLPLTVTTAVHYLFSTLLPLHYLESVFRSWEALLPIDSSGSCRTWLVFSTAISYVLPALSRQVDLLFLLHSHLKMKGQDLWTDFCVLGGISSSQVKE